MMMGMILLIRLPYRISWYNVCRMDKLNTASKTTPRFMLPRQQGKWTRLKALVFKNARGKASCCSQMGFLRRSVARPRRSGNNRETTSRVCERGSARAEEKQNWGSLSNPLLLVMSWVSWQRLMLATMYDIDPSLRKFWIRAPLQLCTSHLITLNSKSKNNCSLR